MIVQLNDDVAARVCDIAFNWGVEPGEVVDRILRKELLDGQDGIQPAELIGAE